MTCCDAPCERYPELGAPRPTPVLFPEALRNSTTGPVVSVMMRYCGATDLPLDTESFVKPSRLNKLFRSGDAWCMPGAWAPESFLLGEEYANFTSGKYVKDLHQFLRCREGFSWVRFRRNTAAPQDQPSGLAPFWEQGSLDVTSFGRGATCENSTVSAMLCEWESGVCCSPRDQSRSG